MKVYYSKPFKYNNSINNSKFDAINLEYKFNRKIILFYKILFSLQILIFIYLRYI